MKYSYNHRVLRYYNNPPTGEFVNIGLGMVIMDKKDGLDFIFRVSGITDRLEKFYKGFDTKGFLFFVDDIQLKYKNFMTNDFQLYKDKKRSYLDIQNDLVKFKHNFQIFQWSGFSTGICNDPEKRFDHLYHEYVLANY